MRRPTLLVLLLVLLSLLVWSAWGGGIEFASLDRFKLLVAATAIAVIVLRSRGRFGMGERRVCLATLSLIAMIAWILYFNFFAFHGIGRERVFLHLHDVAHYYLGAKYFPELGYRSLYTGMLRAEAERYQNHFRSLEVRDLDSNALVDIRTLLARSDPVKARFSPQRWTDFQVDVGFFRDRMGRQWGEVLRDHGFNPPPFWPLLGGALANLVPAGGAAGILALTLIDPMLLIATFTAIAWAFGAESALLASIYFCTIYGTSFGWTGGGFLRFLWLASLVGSLCCLERGRTATAGVLVGLSAMLRIFPAWFALPIAVHAARQGALRRLISPRHLRFAVAFAAACAVLFTATLALPSGLRDWQDFRQNMQRHLESGAYNTIGLGEILAYTGPVKATTPEGHARELERRQTAQRAQLAVVLVLAATLALRHRRWPGDVAATMLAIPLLFCTLDLAAYYYAFLILLVPANRASPWRLALLFGVEILTILVGLLESREIVRYFYRNLLVACLLLALYGDWLSSRPAGNGAQASAR